MARLGEAKCAKRAALERKKKLGVDPSVGGGSGEGQWWQKCWAEAAGGGDKGRGPKAYKPNKPVLTRPGPMARRIIIIIIIIIP